MVSIVLLIYYDLFELTGPRGFEIVYSCDVPNYSTGICELPVVYVNTRVRPNSMSLQELQAIDGVIDYIVKPYCYSKEDLPKIIYRDGLRACDDDVPPQDFLNFVAGYNISLTGPAL